MARSRDGVEIAYDTHGDAGGDALTVVLVHGWAGNRTYWASQVDILAERHQVVALDLGGHGESGVGRGDWNLPACGDDVVAVVEEVGADDEALLGHSMGGDAIVYAATSLGGWVRGLVWVDAFRSLGHEPTSSAEDVARVRRAVLRGLPRRRRPESRPPWALVTRAAGCRQPSPQTHRRQARRSV